jgi:hypothetical protein
MRDQEGFLRNRACFRGTVLAREVGMGGISARACCSAVEIGYN